MYILNVHHFLKSIFVSDDERAFAYHEEFTPVYHFLCVSHKCPHFYKIFVSDDERAFAYVRVYTGDELSKRAKFALLTWIGTSVGALKRAKTSTDKSFVKQVIPVSLHDIPIYILLSL